MPDFQVVTAMDEVADDGAFKRKESTFRDWIKADGSTAYPPAKGRYHLIIAYACPWANRTNAARKLKGLDDAIDLTIVEPVMRLTKPQDSEDKHVGWYFRDNDQYMGCRTVREFYEKFGSGQVTKFTVPILFDTKTKKIVNNESSEIVRMFNSEMNEFATQNQEMDMYPEAQRASIDEVNDWVYPMINNGVYKAGFARTQSAYDVAVEELFKGLDQCEEILSKQRYIAADSAFTEADLRLFMTLVRFDEVYTQHFKCNKKRIEDYPNLLNYVREIYQMDGIHETINMKEIKEHYFCSHETINKYGIIAVGPGVDYSLPHNRTKLFPSKI